MTDSESACMKGFRKHREVVYLASGYSLFSSSLVVFNKWVVVEIPFGASVTAVQFGFAALFVWLIGRFGLAEVDPMEMQKVWAFLPAVVLFYISVASNMKLLEHANVDTYIVVRACTPLATLLVELVVSKVPVPSWKSIATLVLIIAGACGYVFTDEGFRWDAYMWATLYLVAMTVDQVVIKKVVTNVKLSSWGLVLYNNLIAVCLWPIGALATGELSRLYGIGVARFMRFDVVFPVLISCIFGTGISYFGLNARRALTATAFTVLGVVCKFATVLINTAVWTRHASPFGIGCVCVCIAGGILYQQVEKEKVLTPAPKEEVEEEQNPTAAARVTAASGAQVRSSSIPSGAKQPAV